MHWLRKVAELFSYHRKFSSIQKIILIFVILLIFSVFSQHILLAFIFYILVTVTTFLVCQYLISSKHNFRFFLSIYLKVHCYPGILTTVLNCKSKLQEILYRKDEKEEFRSEDGECFYDANETNTLVDHDNKEIKPSPSSNVKWTDEIDAITDLIRKHFIYTWLFDFEPHIDFKNECDQVIRDGIYLFVNRLKAIDPHVLVKELCLNGRQHLKMLQTSRDKFKTQPRRKRSTGRRDSGSLMMTSSRKFASVEEAFETISTYHIGLYDIDNEENYLYSICDILLKRTFGDSIMNCQVPSFILSEILMCNLIFPLAEMLSEPDFIFEKLILILSDEPIDFPVEEEEFFQNEDEEHEYEETMSHNTSNYKEQLADRQQRDRLPSDTKSSVSAQAVVVLRQPDMELQVPPPETNTQSETNEKLQTCENVLETTPENVSEMKTSGKPEFFISYEDSNNDNKVEKYMQSLEIIEQKPSVFQDISIVDDEIRNESRSSSQFVLYTIQYEAFYWVDADKEPVLRTREVKRRHREFINLHSRLEDNANYKTSLKGIKGPKRWQTLPFGNLNKRSIEDRRKSLEAYLKSLIKKEDICNGPEMNEFLAYGGNAHIAFVRNSQQIINVPRFDKMLVKTVSGVFDELIKIPSKVSFPSLPGKKDTNKEDEKEDCDDIKVEFDQDSKCGNEQEEIKGFISICNMETNLSSNIPEEKITEKTESTEEDKMSLAEAVVDIGVQTLQGKDNWVCREKVIIVTKRLIGVVLDRWLKEQIEDLTTEQMCVKYLKLLRETVWPGGELFETGRPVKTDRHKAVTKEQARRCLNKFFPDTLKRIVGNEDFDHAINEVIETLQYQKLNRHLIYILLDHLIHCMYPEIGTSTGSVNHQKDDSTSTDEVYQIEQVQPITTDSRSTDEMH